MPSRRMMSSKNSDVLIHTDWCASKSVACGFTKGKEASTMGSMVSWNKLEDDSLRRKA